MKPVITATTIAQKWADALVSDAQLAAWCNDTFGAPVAIFRGESPNHMRDPGENIPFVILDVIHGETGAIPDFKFMLLCIVGIKLSENPDPAFDVLGALAPLDQGFKDNVLRVLRASDPNLLIEHIDGDYEDAFDPQFRHEMTVTVSVPRNLARGAY